MSTERNSWPFGFGNCSCGCGRKTEIAKRTYTKKGSQKGQPLRFIYGHHATHKIDPAQRFWAKVDKRGPNECWPWQAGTMVKGYGVFYRSKRQPVGAHRFSWELEHGPIPDGIDICHSCDNPPCCNPAHLFAGTQTDNSRDMIAKGRHSGVIPPPRYGKANNNTKLTTEEVEAIRKLRAQGWTLPKIAARFNIHKQTAQAITSGRSRKHG